MGSRYDVDPRRIFEVRLEMAANNMSGDGIAAGPLKWFSGNQKESNPMDSAISAWSASSTPKPVAPNFHAVTAIFIVDVPSYCVGFFGAWGYECGKIHKLIKFEESHES